MIVYVNNSYRSLYKAMTGKEYEPGSPNLTWNMFVGHNWNVRIKYKP